jgi:hypothetical protein
MTLAAPRRRMEDLTADGARWWSDRPTRYSKAASRVPRADRPDRAYTPAGAEEQQQGIGPDPKRSAARTSLCGRSSIWEIQRLVRQPQWRASHRRNGAANKAHDNDSRPPRPWVSMKTVLVSCSIMCAIQHQRNRFEVAHPLQRRSRCCRWMFGCPKRLMDAPSLVTVCFLLSQREPIAYGANPI